MRVDKIRNLASTERPIRGERLVLPDAVNDCRVESAGIGLQPPRGPERKGVSTERWPQSVHLRGNPVEPARRRLIGNGRDLDVVAHAAQFSADLRNALDGTSAPRMQ